MKITSVNNELIKTISKLNRSKARKKQQRFLVEGYHMVQEALDSGYLEMVFSLRDEDFLGAECYEVSESVLKKITSEPSSQGIVGVCKMIRTKSIDYSKSLIVLENVQDPGNVGTILRTSAAFGIDQILMVGDCSSIYNKKTIASSQGAMFKVATIDEDLSGAVETLKRFEPIATAIDPMAIKLRNFQKTTAKPIALIFGNEGQGVSNALQAVGHKLYIPIPGMESLNVAIAAGICIHYLLGE